MRRPIPLVRDLVLVGGGHTHALVLLAWAMRPLPGARLTLIDPNPAAPYSGMLPGHIAGHYPRAALEIDLVRLARHAGARLVIGRASGIDRAAGRIEIAGRPDIAYDTVAFDIGATADMPALAGFATHAWPAKPLGPFADAWADFVAAQPACATPRIAVIGGGVAGIELALAMAHRLRTAGTTPAVTVLEAGPTALPGPGAGTRRRIAQACDAAGVTLRTDAPVVQVAAGRIMLGDGTVLAADFILGAAGARAAPWLARTGLATDRAGFLAVGPTLQSLNDPAVFAAGDCAALTHAPRPKAGVYAVRAAPVLAHNLRAALSGGPMRRFRPQRDYLKLISLGDRVAVGQRSGLTASGPWLWRQKDRIDRAFMARFQRLRPMPAAPLPHPLAKGVRAAMADGPLCGGCGAKAPAQALRAGLAGLAPAARDDVVAAAGDDAAVLRWGSAGLQVLSTDQLRAFTDDPYLLARIATVHALGDVWAMGATPQVALAQITLPEMSARLAAETLREITAGARAVLDALGAELVGGHTAFGPEMAIGFTVTGRADRAVGLAGARPGDALVLTKPLGTGVVLAAEMRGAAPGRAVAAALASMARPMAADAAILAPVAHAMTDVTGFGLAGHLAAIARASGLAAEIDLTALPLLGGAAELAGRGHHARLWAANRAAAPVAGAGDDAPARLLHDPQTAGGLLAALPQAQVAGVLKGLGEAGIAAALIGHVSDGTPGQLTTTTGNPRA
jgi:selenide,water dikinase